MNKTITLYRNEVYKIVHTRMMLIVLILLLILPGVMMLSGRGGPSYETEQATIDAAYLESNRVRQREYLQNQITTNEQELGRTLHHALEGAARREALARYDALVAAQPELAAVTDISTTVLQVARLAVWLDPTAYGVTLPDDRAPETVIEANWQIVPSEQREEMLPRERAVAEALLAQAEAAFAENDLQALYRFTADFEAGWMPSHDTNRQLFEEARQHYFRSLAEGGEPSLEARFDSGYNWAAISQYANRITLERSLEGGIDLRYEGGGPVTPLRAREIRDELAIARFIGEHDMAAQYRPSYRPPARASYFSAWMLVSFILAVFMGVVAGGLVSQELESGSIKLLIIAPVKRWRIYIAKLLALITTAVLLSALNHLWLQLLLRLIHGAQSVPPIVSARNGQAYLLSFASLAALDMAFFCLKLIFYGCFAMMVSSLLRRSALSVGIAVGVAFLDFFATVISFNIAWRYWMRIMPFINLDLGNHFYPTLMKMSMGWSEQAPHATMISLPLAIVYILGFIALFVWTGVDAFARRDI